MTETGYDTANTDQIAEWAGINIGSLYQYFSSKEAIATQQQALAIARQLENRSAQANIYRNIGELLGQFKQYAEGQQAYQVSSSESESSSSISLAGNDASTSLLMQQFYRHLATSNQPITKSEAIRQAQLSLLQGKLTAKDAPQRAGLERDTPPLIVRSRSDFSHPFYWAPFISSETACNCISATPTDRTRFNRRILEETIMPRNLEHQAYQQIDQLRQQRKSQ
ncbi:hypothetical protein NIES2104_34610 [Leptolyngbya sp. NIES-2104]|nr:hypothetical protein NIES2104_34610 [Leptolyngbya sp. NIES-2104]